MEAWLKHKLKKVNSLQTRTVVIHFVVSSAWGSTWKKMEVVMLSSFIESRLGVKDCAKDWVRSTDEMSFYCTDRVERLEDELIEPTEVRILIWDEIMPASQSSGGKDT